MSKDSNHNSAPDFKNGALGYLLLLWGGGVAAFFFMLLIPSESYASGLFGYSLPRLLMTAGMVSLELVLLGFIILIWKKSASWKERLDRWGACVQKQRPFNVIIAISLLGLILGLDYLHSIAFNWDRAASPLLLRLTPLIAWMTWAAFLSLIFLVNLKCKGENENVDLFTRPFQIAFLTVILLVTGLGWLLGKTGLGMQPDITGWDFPGTPLLFSQIFAALLLGWLLFHLLIRNQKMPDWLVFILLWVIAAGVWIAEPMHATHYSLEPTAPNYEFTPNSDAALLVVNSENVLTGDGFQLTVEKPLYNIFLSLWLKLGDHQYDRVVNLQILVLALFPAAVYLISATMNQRLAGIILGGMLILREQNAIALSNRINVSNSKMIMTDFPAALGVSVFVLVFMFWLRNPQKKNMALIAGGVLGAMILLRSQAIIFLPVVGLVLMLEFWKKWKFVFSAVFVFFLGMLAFILPWMVRNWRVVGEFGYSQPMQAVYLDSQYTFEPGVFDLAGEQPKNRIDQGFGNARQFALENPGYVLQFIANHFFHNEVAALLVMPVRFDLTETLISNFSPMLGQPYSRRAYIDSQPFWDFQERWQGEWPQGALIILSANLILICIGLSAAWKSDRWLGLAPLPFHFAYSFSSAIARVSGSRFILPVDWILLWYYAVGVTSLLYGLFKFSVPQSDYEPPVLKDEFAKVRKPILVWLVILLLGALIPLIEILPPPRYPDVDPAALMFSMNFEVDDFCDLDGQPITIDAVIQGRVLFPRFYRANEGYSHTSTWVAQNYFTFSRIGFYLAGPDNSNIILPMEAAPEFFPTGADAIVIGNQEDGYIQALAASVSKDGVNSVTYTSNWLRTCHP